MGVRWNIRFNKPPPGAKMLLSNVIIGVNNKETPKIAVDVNGSGSTQSGNKA